MTQRVAEDKAKETLTSLVRLFFEHAHPFVPVLDKQDFLQRWDEDRESIPLPIRSAIFSLAEALNDVPDNALKWFHLARGLLITYCFYRSLADPLKCNSLRLSPRQTSAVYKPS